MQTTEGLALEIRLSAYLDGEVSDAERRDLDRLMARDEDARRMMDNLKAGSAVGHAALESILHDPVPLSLVRRIRQGADITPRTERVVGAPRPRRNRLWPRALAASFGMLLVGGSTGYLIGRTMDDNLRETQTATPALARTWLGDMADHHRVYARQQRHLVEVPASESAEIRSWLVTSTGVPFALPDLTRNGLTFEGARLLVSAGKPTGQLVYRNAEGEIFAICFLKSAADGEETRLSESMRDDLAMISWQKPGATYVVIGPSAAADLRQLAETVENAI